jgi:hypothetical protein
MPAEPLYTDILVRLPSLGPDFSAGPQILNQQSLNQKEKR